MTTDLEADLRREFDAAEAPSGLTFSPDSVLRQGSRTIRRRRIIAIGSTAMAVALVVVGSTLVNRPHNSAVPQPAKYTATTGIVRAQVGFTSGTFQVEFNRDSKVEPNVRYSVITPDGKRHDVGGSSTYKPGSEPVDATWGSGLVDGHPVTIGLLPTSADDPQIAFADGSPYGYGMAALDDTGYTMFAIMYPATARPTDIESIRWRDATGVVDGIAGAHRITGQVFSIDPKMSIEVVLQPGDDGQTTVFGRIVSAEEPMPSGDATVQPQSDLSAAFTDSSGVAVVTGRQPTVRKTKGAETTTADGAPIAAGILPPGASEIGVDLKSNQAMTGIAVTQRLPDGRVIFALRAYFAHPSDPGQDSITAITWTNADGSQGRKDVIQKQR